ncbi:hypothetical protein ACJQWK_03985 [Exserohilum turcicum]
MSGKLPPPSRLGFSIRMLFAQGITALVRAFRAVTQILERLWVFLETVFVKIATLPYYRLYHFNTIDPLQKLADLASETPLTTQRFQRALSSWRARKLSELQFTTISKQTQKQCTVLAAAVIGAFSWTTISEAYWLTHGFWHMSLILAILGILLSASEVTVLNLLGPVKPLVQQQQQQQRPVTTLDIAIAKYRPLLFTLTTDNAGAPRYAPRRKMVFTWQAPLMFMSYSVCAFLAGLTILVCSPFIRRDKVWGDGHNIAIMYLTAFFSGASCIRILLVLGISLC